MRSSPVYLTGAEFHDAIEHAHRWTEFYDDEGRPWFQFTMPNINCLETAYRDVLDYMVAHCRYEPLPRGDGHVDRSKQDFAVSETMLMLGFEPDFVGAALNVGSEKAHARRDSEQYVLATVQAAANSLEGWS
jgi:hypothetical protein